jgi:RNA polymerase sigma factor (sigma-70 family)|nr:MAG TPA: DNA-directed RNA polymerase subunit alpha [Caudoviricetes sp.]
MDARQAKRDSVEKTTGRVYDILKNHDQESRTIEAQIEAERAALEEDLAEIRSRAYPRGVRYDTPRVQSSPDPDGLLVKVAAAIERRTDRTKRAVAALEERQRQIDRVHDAVLDMDARSKIVLLTLYYPRRTYEQAAEALGVDVSTVSRQRKTAVDRLTRKLIRLYGEIK